MKKLLFTSILLLGTFFTIQAQEIAENALGLRLGGANGVGAEISYQRKIGTDNNRLEFDLGWRNDSHFDLVKATGLYQWVWNIEGGFNWYAGAGAGFGIVDDNYHDDYNHDDGAFLYAAGNIGVEYNFDIPLQVFIDLRPEIGFSDYDVIDDFVPDFALGVRYQF
ncbi:hypothetical protein SAMN04488096_10249 [Mesonia phycicola]|uniref:Outer membrane insertion C-terminal signal n=1 Tax=Mesonia phycicola TaxID=579105 RepID=A0A1M6BH93_9FLAO|nr:hypothetical protein [Mesonia phycicola]SHI48075.1 hypothetical protein SAMN04488096_10249 [Mesonia phycicola]